MREQGIDARSTASGVEAARTCLTIPMALITTAGRIVQEDRARTSRRSVRVDAGMDRAMPLGRDPFGHVARHRGPWRGRQGRRVADEVLEERVTRACRCRRGRGRVIGPALTGQYGGGPGGGAHGEVPPLPPGHRAEVGVREAIRRRSGRSAAAPVARAVESPASPATISSAAAGGVEEAAQLDIGPRPADRRWSVARSVAGPYLGRSRIASRNPMSRRLPSSTRRGFIQLSCRPWIRYWSRTSGTCRNRCSSSQAEPHVVVLRGRQTLVEGALARRNTTGARGPCSHAGPSPT